MLRTRDFVLLFTAIIFLIVALGATVINILFPAVSVPQSLVPAEPQSELEADLQMPELDRAARAAALAKKIAEDGSVYISAPASVDVDEAPVEPDVSDAVTIIDPLLCGNYRTYVGPWPSRALTVTVAEGVRVYSQTTVVASSSIVTPLLTISAVPVVGIPYCLSTDVIGVATDGSLIRNTEVGLYGIFGSDTLIGYALDGFPIYGRTTSQSDECGGVTTASGYRYHVSPERPYVLACFSGLPAPLQ